VVLERPTKDTMVVIAPHTVVPTTVLAAAVQGKLALTAQALTVTVVTGLRLRLPEVL
jgi:hypothetical protein